MMSVGRGVMGVARPGSSQASSNAQPSAMLSAVRRYESAQSLVDFPQVKNTAHHALEHGKRNGGETGRRGDGETERRRDGEETGRRGDGETGKEHEGSPPPPALVCF